VGKGKERKVKATMTAVRIGILLDSTRSFLMVFGGIRQGSFPYGIKGGLGLRLDGGTRTPVGTNLGFLVPLYCNSVPGFIRLVRPDQAFE
jgi:hypothetical protein